MPEPPLIVAILLVGAVFFGLSLLVRSRLKQPEKIDPDPWSSALAYLSTAYGLVSGFLIIIVFGQFFDARSAVGDEASAIGTAFEEARLFPENSTEIQKALICYATAVPEYEWPALQRGESAPEVDRAYADIFKAVDAARGSTGGTLSPGLITTIGAQLGDMSTARETRLLAAREIGLPLLVWAILVGGGLIVLGLLFVVTLRAPPLAQATLMAVVSMFTSVIIFLILALSTPFGGQLGIVSPRSIEAVNANMQSSSPEAAAQPCGF